MRAVTPRDPRSFTGALVLAVALAAILLAWLRPNPFSNPRTVEIVFDDAAAVGPLGAEVRMAGTPVGKVTARERDGDDAVLTAELDDDAGELHADATAKLRPRLAFEGTAFVDLDPGSETAPPLEGRIERADTRTYTSLDEVLRVAPEDTRRAIQRSAHGLDAVVAADAPHALNRTLARGPALLGDLATGARAARGPGSRALTRAIRGFAATSEAVAERQDDLVPLLAGADRTAAAFDTNSGAAIEATLARVPGTLARMRTGGTALDGIAERLKPLVDDLRPGARDLAPALRDVRPLLRELGPALTNAHPVIDDLRHAVTAGGESADPTRATIAAAEPTVELLHDSLVPALLKPTELGMPAYQSFLNLFEGGGGASRPFQSAANSGPEKMGDGHFMRFGFRFLTGVGFPAPPCDLLEQANAELADAFASNGGCTP